MIDGDAYIYEYYQNNSENLSRLIKNKYINTNFTKLSADRKLVQVNVDILLKDTLYIREIKLIGT